MDASSLQLSRLINGFLFFFTLRKLYMKTCRKCKIDKALEHFYKIPKAKDKLYSYCKSCCYTKKLDPYAKQIFSTDQLAKLNYLYNLAALGLDITMVPDNEILFT